MPPRTQVYKLVVKRRSKSYPVRPTANRVVQWINGRKKVILVHDPGGQGREIVQELTVCGECHRQRSVEINGQPVEV